MTYKEAIHYLFSQLPMFQRVGAAAYKADLSNTTAICAALGTPETKFKSIHVAGTNGKGSVSSALASIFAESGYRTGLFTSPHLKDFRERIRIDGICIDESHVTHFVEQYIARLSHLKPSFFELTCCMAFEYFAQRQVDIAILETGMGGRLDSTNVVRPELSVITSISMDHQQFLGDTLEKIAAEKGGIIKGEVPVVLSENGPAVRDIIRSMAVAASAKLYEVHSTDPGVETDLGGIYQAENMRTVVKCVEALRSLGWNLPENAVIEGARKVKANTGLRGRWELLSTHPRVIADVAHNEEGVALVAQMLRNEPYNQLHMVWGMVSDKDATAILRLLPRDAKYYWCKPDIPRGRDASGLAAEASTHGLTGEVYTSVSTAFAEAKRNAMPDDFIFAGGSVFVVAEII